jgi:hypothetical protein
MQRLALSSLVLAAAIVAPPTMPIAANAAWAGPLHAGCWVVVDPGDEGNLDNAQEVLCVDKSGHGAIRESSYYGDGVKGCDVVSIGSQGGKLVVDVDYKRCTNNAPSHRLICDAAAASGAFPCVQNMANESGEGLPVKLAPLPAGR